MRNMKRWMAVLLAMALLLTGMALAEAAEAAPEAEQAAPEAEAAAPKEAEAAEQTETAEAAASDAREWREGTSPAKPYAGVPEVNLSEQLGYMIFLPTQQQNAQNSCQKLYIYLPRTDVQAGKGTLYLCTEEDGEIWRTAMNDTSAVTVHELTGTELDSLMWGEGTAFEIQLPRSLELGKTYFVNMERKCIVTKDGKLDNPEVGGTQSWRFTVEGDYGVSLMEYRRPKGNPDVSAMPTVIPRNPETAEVEATPAPAATVEYEGGILHPQAGDEIRFDVVIGGDAASAVVYGDETVDFPVMIYEQSGEVTGKVLAENPAWGVMFLDKDGNELHRVEFH